MQEIVYPGDLIADTQIRAPNVYVENGKSYSMVLGFKDSSGSGIIPFEGGWVPKIEETVIGIISSERNNVYEVDLGSHHRALIIGGKYERFSFQIGDVVEATVKDIEDGRTIILSYPNALKEGTVISIKPSKIPRLIGKNNTMINQISQGTSSKISVGMNGMVWIRDGNVALATAAILRVEEEAHVPGLTGRIKEMVEKR
jgi:exosome complex component RRP4